MPLSLRESVDRISDPCNLGATVEEVFSLVLGCACSPIEEVNISEEKSLMAVVGFGGVLSGACILRCGSQAALTIAGRMMNAVFSNSMRRCRMRWRTLQHVGGRMEKAEFQS